MEMLISLSKAKYLFTGEDPWMSHISDGAFLEALQEEYPQIAVNKGGKWFVKLEGREHLKRLANFQHRDIALDRSLPQVPFARKVFEREVALSDQTVANTLYWGRKAAGFLDSADGEKAEGWSVEKVMDVVQAAYWIANVFFLPEKTGECFMIGLLAKVWERELEEPGFAWAAAQNGILTSLIPKIDGYTTGYLATPGVIRGQGGCRHYPFCHRIVNGYCEGSRGKYYGRCALKIADYVCPDEINFLASAYWSYKNVRSLQEIDSDIIL